MDKAPDAFRTISEVAEDLDVPQHVLRFWETRFGQIKPLKRGGGRRYYRPDDVDLLRGIRHLLYGEGYTIRGVQRILKDNGLKFVQSVWTSGAPQPEVSHASEIEPDSGLEHGDPASGHAADAHHAGGHQPGDHLPSHQLLPDRQRPDDQRADDPLPGAERDRSKDIRVGHGHAAHQDFGGAHSESGAVRAREDVPFDAGRLPAGPGAEYATVEDGITDDGALEDLLPEGDEPAGGHAIANAGAIARPFVQRPEGAPSGRTIAVLSPDDRRRLQATLFELHECRRILDAALKDEA